MEEILLLKMFITFHKKNASSYRRPPIAHTSPLFGEFVSIEMESAEVRDASLSLFSLFYFMSLISSLQNFEDCCSFFFNCAKW